MCVDTEKLRRVNKRGEATGRSQDEAGHGAAYPLKQPGFKKKKKKKKLFRQVQHRNGQKVQMFPGPMFFFVTRLLVTKKNKKPVTKKSTSPRELLMLGQSTKTGLTT